MITENKCRLTRERLDELLRFDPATGHFYWRKKRGKTRAGTQAGTLNDNGYVIIGVDYRRYRAHHLVWLHLHGELPSKFLDHINGVRHDNRPENLREVTRRIDAKNQQRRVSNLSGATGVHWDKSTQRWCAEIKNGTVREPLGQFHKRSDAFAARWAAEERHDFYPNHGSDPVPRVKLEQVFDRGPHPMRGITRTPSGRYQVRTYTGGRETYIGCYASVEEAARARDAVERRIRGGVS